MTPVLPRFRSDLTVSEQRTHDGTVFVVKDPVTREFYRLGETERFISEQCDGATPAEVVRRRTEEKFGASLPPEALEQFLCSLRAAGLLESPHPGTKPRTRRRRLWPRGNLLYFRVPLCDPDRLISGLVRRIAFFFTPGFLAVSAALILFAIAITISNWADVPEELGLLYRFSAIPLIWLTIWVVMAAHEFAHGLTCKHFGGEVHEMGFMLVYLQPAAYCNVSDAWLFPEKSKRLWVTIAGPYFEMFIWALAVLTWRATNLEAWIHQEALIVAATSGIKIVLNLNPLLKLDGYYFLSDLLEIPNLRRKAFRAIGDRLRALFGSADAVPDGLSARERRFCFAYGLIAVVFSISFLAFAVAKLSRYVFRDQPLAFALALGFVGLKLPRRLRRMFGRSRVDLDPDDEFDSTPAGDPSNGTAEMAEDRVPAPSEPHGKAPHHRGRRMRMLVAAAVVVPVLLFLPLELKIRGAFEALPGHNAFVRAEVEGIVEKVFVDEGDHVRAGDVIARLSPRDLLPERRRIAAQIEQSDARLRMLEAGPTRQEIDVDRAAVVTAEGHAPYARNRLAVSRKLFEQGAITRRELEVSEEEATAAENDLAEARNKLRLLLSGTRPEELAATRAEIKGLEVQQGLLDEQLKLLEIRSPIEGIVATPSTQLHDLSNLHVAKGDLIAEVSDNHSISAIIAVPEQDIADVAVGQTVLVKARARPDVTFHGRVTAVGAAAQGGVVVLQGGQLQAGTPTFGGGNVAARTVLVTTNIDNHALILKPQMTGQAKILCGKRKFIDLMGRSLARVVKVEFWSWS